MDNRSIGLLDSGLGDLTALKKVMKKLPNEATVFISDQTHMLYGDEATKEVMELTRKSVDFLLSKNVEIIIFACNIVTTVAIEMIQERIVPRITRVIQSGSLTTAEITRDNKVAVIDTHVATGSYAYSKEIKSRSPDIEVTKFTAPKLAPFVEVQRDSVYNTDVVKDSLDSLKGKDFDTMVLGCTHYLVTEREASEITSSTTKLVGSAGRVAQHTENILKWDGMLAGERGGYEYCTIDDCKRFAEITHRRLDDPQLVTNRVGTEER